MADRQFDDPVLELALRTSDGDPAAILDMADVTDDEAEAVLEVLAEVDAEEQARGIAATLRQQGHTL